MHGIVVVIQLYFIIIYFLKNTNGVLKYFIMYINCKSTYKAENLIKNPNKNVGNMGYIL